MLNVKNSLGGGYTVEEVEALMLESEGLKDQIEILQNKLSLKTDYKQLNAGHTGAVPEKLVSLGYCKQLNVQANNVANLGYMGQALKDFTIQLAGGLISTDGPRYSASFSKGKDPTAFTTHDSFSFTGKLTQKINAGDYFILYASHAGYLYFYYIVD